MITAEAKTPALTKGAPIAYTVAIRPRTDTTGYYAVCDTPNGGCVAQGETLQEIQKRIVKAMEFHLEDRPDVTDYYLSFEVYHAQNTDN